jgi:hypothetical protein
VLLVNVDTTLAAADDESTAFKRGSWDQKGHCRTWVLASSFLAEWCSILLNLLKLANS